MRPIICSELNIRTKGRKFLISTATFNRELGECPIIRVVTRNYPDFLSLFHVTSCFIAPSCCFYSYTSSYSLVPLGGRKSNTTPALRAYQVLKPSQTLRSYAWRQWQPQKDESRGKTFDQKHLICDKNPPARETWCPGPCTASRQMFGVILVWKRPLRSSLLGSSYSRVNPEKTLFWLAEYRVVLMSESVTDASCLLLYQTLCILLLWISWSPGFDGCLTIGQWLLPHFLYSTGFSTCSFFWTLSIGLVYPKSLNLSHSSLLTWSQYRCPDSYIIFISLSLVLFFSCTSTCCHSPVNIS